MLGHVNGMAPVFTKYADGTIFYAPAFGIKTQFRCVKAHDLFCVLAWSEKIRGAVRSKLDSDRSVWMFAAE
jgi:hypothetical protein